MNDIEMMRVALDAARSATASGDIPVGAAIFDNHGEISAICAKNNKRVCMSSNESETSGSAS